MIYRLNRGFEFRSGVRDYAPFLVAIIVGVLFVVFFQQIAEFAISLSFKINL